MFGHDDNQDEDKDVQINDELLQPDEQHSEQADQTDSSDEGGAVEVAPSAPPTDDEPADAPSDASASEPTVEPTTPVVSSHLLDIKQQALQSLSPLLGHLDQTPEEKFRTTMMLIQASDNQDLIKVAFESAQGITDEKIRAQALLDIVNEINYFTTKS